MNSELKKALNAIIKKTPSLVRNIVDAGTLKSIVLDSPQLNYQMGGAIAIGRIYQFFGPESGGKTTLVNYLAGQLQRKLPELLGAKDKNVVIFADFERSFIAEHAQENGLLIDEDHLIFMRPDSIEDFVDAVVPLVQTGNIAAIIVDSEAAAPTRNQMVDEFGKACVAPWTKVCYSSDNANCDYTIESLFKEAGYENYKELPVMKFVKPKKQIKVKSFDFVKNNWVNKDVTQLIYKGEAENGYQVLSDNGVFVGTKDHLLYEAKLKKYVSLEDAFKMESFYGLNDIGNEIKVSIKKHNLPFSILDLTVKDTENYLTGGMLSHNTFGGAAKAIAEGLRKLNIINSNNDTTLFVISQERANMCVAKETNVDWIKLV